MEPGAAMSEVFDVSVRGRRTKRPSIVLCGVTVVCAGRLIKVGEIFDEYWLHRSSLPQAGEVIEALRSRTDRPDIFTFTQRVPETEPIHPYRFEFENYAVLPVDTYEQWFER